ncbi:MAG: hypothetical protein IJC48_05930 [Clostridia bacterium]|nr:hypothetical protein [Clostridia bacterium]MBQ4156885.1 hypothetical protein [Clostridia bacterium]
MKKLISLFLVIMMSVFAIASVSAEANEYILYTHPTVGYSLEYPSDWIALDTESVQELLTLFADDSSVEGLDLKSLAQQLTGTDMAMFIDMYGNNVNIIKQAMGMPISASDFVTVLPMFMSQFEASYPGITFFDEGTVYTAGANQYAKMAYGYDLGGFYTYGEQFYDCSTGDLYTITFTAASGSSEADIQSVYPMIDHMLATFNS